MRKLRVKLAQSAVAMAGVATLIGGIVAAPALSGTAAAQPGGVDRTPVMGWSSWSFLRMGVNAGRIEAEARALKSTGLARAGYRYVNVDDNWYECPGPQGPVVDRYGRWVVNPKEFPARQGRNGIAVVASRVHRLGLKFGIYETSGISEQAVKANTPVMGTRYTAREIVSKARANNYNCGGMVQLDYRSAGAQAYVDSVVRELAGWGVDFIKLDGITNRDGPAVKAWSEAIRRSGRRMVLDVTQGSYTIKLAPTLERYANQWEWTPDIENNGPDEGSASSCNAAPFAGCRSVFPLTSYAHWKDRFAAAARWAGVGGPGGFNDFDSIEVGNGSARSGMSVAAEQSQLSLWALGSAPLILGGDLANGVTNAYGSHAGLTARGLRMLENPQMIAIDQDAIDAHRIAMRGTAQVFAKREPSGDAVVGLFDTATTPGSAPDVITVTPRALGLRSDPHGYRVLDVWTGATSHLAPTGRIDEHVPPEGVALLRVTPAR